MFIVFAITTNPIRKLHFADSCNASPSHIRVSPLSRLACICFAFSSRAHPPHSCPPSPSFLLAHPLPRVSHVFTFYINNLVPLSFALQNMDVAKASERLLKLAVSTVDTSVRANYTYACKFITAPGASEIRYPAFTLQTDNNARR